MGRLRTSTRKQGASGEELVLALFRAQGGWILHKASDAKEAHVLNQW